MAGGSKKDVEDRYPWVNPPASGIVFHGTSLGVELMQWGLGRPGSVQEFLGQSPDDFLVEGVSVDTTGVVPGPQAPPSGASSAS
jgi:hypothetical protein